MAPAPHASSSTPPQPAARKRRGTKLKIPAAFLLLSLLSLGATIDLKIAGAKGDGASDDSNAIQNAINNSVAGDTIQCSAGTYKLTKMITFLSSRTYQGLAGCVLTGAIGRQLVQLEYDNAHDLKIDGFTFQGGGILSNGSSTTHPANNLTISNNQFRDIILAGNYNADAIHAWVGTTNTLISGNTFSNIYDAAHVNGWSEVCGAIWLFDAASTTVSNNTFNGTCQAMHFTARQNSHDLMITNNTIHRSARYNIEIQGPFSINNVTLSGNYIDTPQPGINGQAGISLAVGGTGHQIKNNTLLGPNQGNPTNQSDAIEAMGTGFVIQGNFAGHWGEAQLIGWSDATWTTTGNTWCDMTEPTGRSIIYLDTGGFNPAVNTGNTYTASCSGVTFPSPPGASACDLNSDGVTTVVDVQLAVNMSLGMIPCTAKINGAGVCAVTTVQRVVNASLGGACVQGP